MGAHPGPLRAPRGDPLLSLGQVGERLPGPEVAAHVLHRPLHPGLVLRGADPGRVGSEPGVLGVVQPARRQLRVDRVRPGDDRLEVVGDQDLEHPTEERPRRLTPSDHRDQRLGVGQPHEHVPRHDRREDQRVHPPPLARVGVHDEPHLGEVDLALHPRLTVIDPHRGPRSPEPAARHHEPVQGAVRHHATLPSQQLSDLHHRQRRRTATAGHPRRDLLLPGQQQIPRRPVPVRTSRTDHSNHRADQLISQRRDPRLPGQPFSLSRNHVAAGGLAVHPRPLRNRAQTSPVEPPAQHLTHLNHTDLPESHAR
jgi:hypothetical protein